MTTVIVAGAALGFSEMQTPEYQATAQLLLQPSASASVISATTVSPSYVPDQISVIEGPAVARLVAQRLGTAPKATVTNVPNTDVLNVQVASTSPAQAANAANAYARDYLTYERRQTIDDLLAAAKIVQQRISADQAQVSKLQKGSTPNSPTTQAQVAALTQELTVLTSQLDSLQSAAALGSAGASLLSSASTPNAPASPNKARNTGLGLVTGLVLGVALAFLRNNLDDTISTKEDLDRAQPALPTLAEIPYEQHRKGTIELVTAKRPSSEGAEAYRSLRTSVQFLALERPLKSLQLTSPRSGDGKTTTLANLAVTLAGAGQRVIVLDCDLRRSKQHEIFRLQNDIGFTSVLVGDEPLSAVIQPVPEYDDLLKVVTSGPHLPNPSELLASPRIVDIIASLGESSDIVLIDSPPVLPVTDAVAIAPRVDATLLLVSAGRTTAKDLASSLETLGRVSAPVIGAVLNSTVRQKSYGYGRYQYSYHRTYTDPRQARAESIDH